MTTAILLDQKVKYCNSYTGVVQELGVIPDTDLCVEARGLPGALVKWDWLDGISNGPHDENDVNWVQLDRLSIV